MFEREKILDGKALSTKLTKLGLPEGKSDSVSVGKMLGEDDGDELSVLVGLLLGDADGISDFQVGP